MRQFIIMLFIISFSFFFLSPSVLFAQGIEDKSSLKITKSSTKPTEDKLFHQRFLFVVNDPSKIKILVDFIEVFDESGERTGYIDFGANDTKGASFTDLGEFGGRWGKAGKEGSITFRSVAGRDSLWEHSAFSIAMTRPLAKGFTIKIRYKDIGTELLPVEFHYGGKCIRIGQIFSENTGKWLEDEFEIPAADQ